MVSVLVEFMIKIMGSGCRLSEPKPRSVSYQPSDLLQPSEVNFFNCKMGMMIVSTTQG